VSSKIERMLPGYGCGSCGFPDCKQFAEAITEKKVDIDACPFMQSDMFKEERASIQKLVEANKKSKKEKIISLLDKHECDFILGPLDEEPSCREYILPVNLQQPLQISPGSYVKWRPLGCPIVHFGEVFETSPLLGVYPTGPNFTQDKKPIDLGVIFFLAFEGAIVAGKVPDVGETVVFLPEYCMMQKSHSGVIVELIGQRVRIERVDLLVWHKARKFKTA